MNNMYNKILVPTDGSIHSNNAARHAIWIACQMNADIIALNVIENYYVELTAQSVYINRMEDILTDSAKESVDRVPEILTEMKIEGKCKKDIIISRKIREGNPTTEILKIIDEEGIDLVVMGKSGKKGINEFIMGSTAVKVVRKAPCSVLTVL
jgi:nucleotide-binding universal stress UspA family protein